MKVMKKVMKKVTKVMKQVKKRKGKGYYPSNNNLPHSKKTIYREMYENENGDKVINYQMEGEIFDDYNLSINHFHQDLVIGCDYIDYDIEDKIINRKIKLNKKAAWYLVKDLLKYIFTGKI